MSDLRYDVQRAASPVSEFDEIVGSEKLATPPDGMGLCLSGGGYRAMLFHVGAILRLNEAQPLPKLGCVSSVSGGSITAAVLGMNWRRLGFIAGTSALLDELLVRPIRRLASQTIDRRSILGGILLPGSISQWVSRAYDGALFGGKTLQDLPSDFAGHSHGPLDREPFTQKFVLSDGGVYDNLGVETIWKQYTLVLVSDGGGQLEPEGKPASDWARRSKRVLELVDNQVRNLRKRQIIGGFVSDSDLHEGAYWGIRSNITHYNLADVLPCSQDKTLALAETPTRLKRLPIETQNRLMNWGYAVCDAALRRHFACHLPDGLAAPTRFPFEHSIG